MSLLWSIVDSCTLRAWPDEACISVFRSVSRPGKWTWCGARAHGHDLGYYDTADDAKAAAEAWWAATQAPPA